MACGGASEEDAPCADARSLPFPKSLALNPAEPLPPRVRHASAQEAPVLFSDVSGAGWGGVPACVRLGRHVPAANPVPSAHFAVPALPLPLGPAAGQAEALAIPHCLLQEKPRGTACKVVSWPRAPSRACAPHQEGRPLLGGRAFSTPPARRDAPAPTCGALAAPPPGSWPGPRPELWAQRVGEGGPEREREQGVGGPSGQRAGWSPLGALGSGGLWGSGEVTRTRRSESTAVTTQASGVGAACRGPGEAAAAAGWARRAKAGGAGADGK